MFIYYFTVMYITHLFLNVNDEPNNLSTVVPWRLKLCFLLSFVLMEENTIISSRQQTLLKYLQGKLVVKTGQGRLARAVFKWRENGKYYFFL